MVKLELTESDKLFIANVAGLYQENLLIELFGFHSRVYTESNIEIFWDDL